MREFVRVLGLILNRDVAIHLIFEYVNSMAQKRSLKRDFIDNVGKCVGCMINNQIIIQSDT